MRTRHRRATSTPLALLATGALATALIAPAAASADAAARAERLAARSAQRAARSAEREARRAARQKAREERREAHEVGATPKTASEPSTPPTETKSETGTGEGTSNCRPTLRASSDHVLAGETVTLTGTVGCSGVEATAAQQVTISETERGTAPAASAAPSSLSAVPTTADGGFEVVTPALEHTTVFHVKLGKRGARAVVKVAPSVTLNAPASATLSSTVAPVAPSSAPADETTGTPSTSSEPAAPAAHGDTHSRVTFTGAVTPAEPGSRVALQVAYGTEGWHTVALARVGTDGSYALAHRFRKAGNANVRVIAHMHGENVNGVSPVLAYEVTTTASPAS
jgi:hypothetical protein